MKVNAFTKEDFVKIRFQLGCLFISIVVVAASFFSINLLDSSAQRQLTIASGDERNARFKLEQISQEEATIIKNIDRFSAINATGVVGPKDSIDLLDAVNKIRATYNLSTMQRTPPVKMALTLPYAQSAYEPGQPIKLDTWAFDITFPLLHENDLANFISAMLAENLLLLPTRCDLTARTKDTHLINQVGRHFDSRCSFLWYTFTVDSAQETVP